MELTETFLMAGDRRLKHFVHWKYPEGTAKSVEANVRNSHTNVTKRLLFQWVKLLDCFDDKHFRLPRWLSGKESACQYRRPERCRFNPWVGKILRGKGNSNALQYSCLGNHTDRGAWQAIVHAVVKHRTHLSTHTHTHTINFSILQASRLKKKSSSARKQWVMFLICGKILWAAKFIYVQGEEVDITRHKRDEKGCHSHIYLVKMVQIPAMVDWKIMQWTNIQYITEM